MEDIKNSRYVSGIMNISSLLFGTLIIGGIFLLINYIINGQFRSRQLQDLSKNEKSSKIKDIQELSVPQQTSKKKNRKRREPQKQFTHFWILSSLKGHTDRVVSMHLSPSGNFVGTCAEGWLFSWMLPSVNNENQHYEIPSYYYRPADEENIRNRFNCSDLAISQMLIPYILSPEQLFSIGYPMRSSFSDAVTINYVPYPNHYPESMSLRCTDIVAPYMRDATGMYNNYPIQSNINLKIVRCVRCFENFYLTQNNQYIYYNQCIYHWGKFIDKTIDGCPITKKIWSCCNQDNTNIGCSVGKLHVWNGVMPGMNGPFRDFIYTKKPKIPPPDEFYGVYGLDCEMCFTQNGLEPIKVVVVDMNGNNIYNTYVKPQAEIIDCNTRFSGITENDLQCVFKTLNDVHRELESFIYEDTILIGHGLENDLRVLRLLHTRCIDTSILFPHYQGFPYRNSLKYLTKRALKRDIQGKIHCPIEDARAAMDLVLLKLHSDCSSSN